MKVFAVAFLILFCFLTLSPALVAAQNPPNSGSNPPNSGSNPPNSGSNPNSGSAPLTNPLGASSFEDLLKNIVDWLITIATPIAVGMILIGAFQMIFAGGNPERFATGRKTILYTAIGYAIIVVGWGMVSIIRDVLNVQ